MKRGTTPTVPRLTCGFAIPLTGMAVLGDWLRPDLPAYAPALFVLVLAACLSLVGLAVRKLLGSNRRLHRAVRSEQARIRYLALAGERISSSLDLSTVQQAVAETAAEALGDAVRLYAPDERTGLAVLVAEHRKAEPELSAQLPEPDDASVSQVFRNGEPQGEVGLGGTASRLLVPLCAGGRTIGVLDLWCFERSELPSEQERTLAAMLADRAAPSLEHARLHGALTALLDQRTHELADTQRQLLEAERSRAITELAAMVAHEIRNPLNVAKTAAYALRQRVLDDDPRITRNFELLNRHLDTAARIIQDLTDYGALPAPRRGRIDVRGLVRQLTGRFTASPNVDIEVRISPEPLVVEADEIQVCRALQALLINGVDASALGEMRGRVVVFASRQDGHVVVEIRDSGNGFSAAARARVFDPYFSGETKTTGLSMALTRKILEQNGGGIELESTVGVGSCFRAWLPAVLGSAPRSKAAADALADEGPDTEMDDEYPAGARRGGEEAVTG